MLEVGVQVNVIRCTCLVQCLGKTKRIDDLINVSIQRRINLDDRLCVHVTLERGAFSPRVDTLNRLCISRVLFILRVAAFSIWNFMPSQTIQEMSNLPLISHHLSHQTKSTNGNPKQTLQIYIRRPNTQQSVIDFQLPSIIDNQSNCNDSIIESM
ncbi:hypothetical protein YC2023_019021 [Brassica napus]